MSGLAATICWGTHRDTGAILAMGAKVWSLGTCPNGPLELRTRVATALEAANVGKVTVTQQDYVFADDDGVIVVATADLEQIVEAAREIAAREGAQAARLLKGELLRTQLDLKGYVEKRQSDPSYTFRDHLKTFGGAIEI
jgi:4-hydroxy-4-methyl-2-oxoglutarate aldolase